MKWSIAFCLIFVIVCLCWPGNEVRRDDVKGADWVCHRLTTTTKLWSFVVLIH